MAILKYFNPTSGEWEFVAASPTAKFTTWKKTASGGETSLSGNDDNSVTLSYTPGLEQVFLNGVLLVRGTDYTATTGTSITGLSALVASDIVSIICYAPFNVGDAVAKTLIDAKGDLLAGTADNTAGRLAVGTNGQVLVADSGETTGLKWETPEYASAWTTYTPSWTATTTNPVLNNGTIVGRYKQVGKTINFFISITMGSTTTFGSGQWRLTLPVTANNSNAANFNLIMLDAGTAWYEGLAFTAYIGSTTSIALVKSNGASPISEVNSTAPFTWAVSDLVIISGSYEAA